MRVELAPDQNALTCPISRIEPLALDCCKVAIYFLACLLISAVSVLAGIQVAAFVIPTLVALSVYFAVEGGGLKMKMWLKVAERND